MEQKSNNTSVKTLDSTIITRFPPSPTGFMHIGNARTGAFNWLLSKHYGGKCLLRIEDTDKERSTTEAVNVIFKSLQFLGLDFDNTENIIYQSQRTIEYQKIVQILLDKGFAYKCFHTNQELEILKQNNQQSPNNQQSLNNKQSPNNQTSLFRSKWRNSTADEHPDTAYVVRFKIPLDSTITFHDDVQGEICVKGIDIEDFALLRSDGSPTYMIGVVVDDHDMQVNYILRGADHLTNTFKQILIFQAMGWQVPRYAHIPLILDEKGQKLSKRNGSIGVLDYAKAGILPEALLNYILKLGWAHGDEEFIPLNKAIQIFTEKGFGKSAARFDDAKLLDLSGKYMRFLPTIDILQKAQQYNQEYCSNQQYSTQGWQRFANGLEQLVKRSNTLAQLLDLGKIYLLDNVEYSIHCEKLDANTTQILVQFFNITHDNLEQKFRQYCTDNNLEFKQIASWLRKKLTGRQISPSLFDVIQTLGAELCIKRIKSNETENCNNIF